ncbi:MAG: hypothetical protein IPI48_02075 [bacterium]|nr:hypothetical protein [bacterium]
MAVVLLSVGGPGGALAAGAATPVPMASGVPGRVQVTASTAQGLTLAVAGLEARWDQAYLGPDGQPRWALSIDGFTSGGAPGSPRVPTSGSWLVVPPGMRPQLRVLAETWQPADGRQLAFETMPVEVPGSGNQPATLRELLVEPDGVLPPGATILPELTTGRRDTQGLPS